MSIRRSFVLVAGLLACYSCFAMPSWNRQLQQCLQKCPEAPSLDPNCCRDCINQLDFGANLNLASYIKNHAKIICALTPPNAIATTASISPSKNKKPIKAPDKTTPATNQHRFSMLIGGAWESNHVNKNCNRDRMMANIIIDVKQGQQKNLFGRDSGVLKFTPLSRCPNTMYGGMRTTEGPTVSVNATPTQGGYQMHLKFSDHTQYYYTSGKVYTQGDLLNTAGILKVTHGTNVNGSIENFFLPSSLIRNDAELQFKSDKSLTQHLWWTGYMVIFIYNVGEEPSRK